MSKASMPLGRLRKRLWKNYNISIRVKGKIYRVIIPSNLLYEVDTWMLYRRHVKKLHAFMMRHMRSIMKIRWQDKVTNIKILKLAGLPFMEDLLIRKNLHWIGHLLRMPTDRISRQVLYSQLPEKQRSRGRPRFRYKDTIKINLKKRDIDNICLHRVHHRDLQPIIITHVLPSSYIRISLNRIHSSQFATALPSLSLRMYSIQYILL